MKALAETNQQVLALSSDTKALITSSVSENTLRNYRYRPRRIEAWLGGRLLTDALLAAYITESHRQGKSPTTITKRLRRCGRW